MPSISPLLKRYLAKAGTVSTKKENINVALFYDKMWDSNTKNIDILGTNNTEKTEI